MIDSNKLISTQIEKDIPQFIRIEYPNFVSFIKSYYEWMEKEGNPYYFLANSLNYSDVDRTSLEFLDRFGKNFLNPLPDVIYENNNIATLVKNIEQYYSARGSEKAFQFLFRLFEYTDTSEELDFYYPSYDMLRVSDGKWVNERSIKIIDPPTDIITWEHGEIIGDSSGAKSVIDEIKTYTSTSGVNIAEIYLIEFDVIHSPTNFIIGEQITITTLEGDTYSSVIAPIFNNILVNDRGKFNINYQRVKIDSTGIGEDARVVINTIDKGEISDFTVVNGGINYSISDKIYTLSADGDFGSGAYGKVLTVDGSGTILTIKITSEGHDYKYIPSVIIDSENGSGSLLLAESNNIGAVNSLDIRNFGINYSYNDTTITFNSMIRIYDNSTDITLGDTVTGQSSGAVGIIEYWDRYSGLISVNVISGIFTVGETMLSSIYGDSYIIYDISIATGEIIDSIKCLCEYSGKYINMDGHISSLKYIQDSYFYQMFSYMLKTIDPKEDWEDYIKHVHPSGTVGFSYDNIINKYFNESYGGFISPYLETIEFYKFRWDIESYGTVGNTQIKDYKTIIIDNISNINNNITEKTDITYGAEITVI